MIKYLEVIDRNGIILEFINLIDMHTHSVFSFDGNDSCEELCEGALKRGAKAIAITDHCDIDGANLDVDELCSNQIESVKNVSKKYDGRFPGKTDFCFFTSFDDRKCISAIVYSC